MFTYLFHHQTEMLSKMNMKFNNAKYNSDLNDILMV